MKAIAAAAVFLALCAALWADPHPRLAEFKELRDYSSWQEVTDGPAQELGPVCGAGTARVASPPSR